jgi:release factor glutamine methyltransferase
MKRSTGADDKTTLDEAYAFARAYLARYGVDVPDLEAMLLLEEVTGIDRAKIRSVGDELILSYHDSVVYNKYIKRRIRGTPVSYILKKKEFYGLEFYVDENVLIPRPDTERIIDVVVEFVKDNYGLREEDAPISILELCTGSGCIAVSIAKTIKNAVVTATDISEQALKIAKKNAVKNGVGNKISFILSDMFKSVVKKKFDIIISNPPYIETSVIPRLQKEIVNHEPHIALDGGEDGLKFYHLIAAKAKEFLKPSGGAVFLEIGDKQADYVKQILVNEGGFEYENLSVKQDYGNRNRVVAAIL